MQHILQTYRLSNRDFSNPEDRQQDKVDELRAVSEACREDLVFSKTWVFSTTWALRS
jgi:hypothetical protein